MAHRLHHLQKKKIQSSQITQETSNPTEKQQTTQYKQNNRQPPAQQKLPRPIFPPTNQFYNYDSQDYKKRLQVYPPPESLFTVSRTTQPSPLVIRTTSAVISSLPKRINFPIAAWICPLGIEQVHTVDVHSPLRCSRCKSYVNPYFQFDGFRKSATCNICSMKFAIEDTIDKNNFISTEVATQSIIDFRVKDKFYFKKRTDIIKLYFVIEISMPMIQLGIFATVIDSIRSAVQNHTFQQNIRIGLVLSTDFGVNYFKMNQGEDWRELDPIIYQVQNNKAGIYCSPLSDQEYLIDPNHKKEQLLYMLDYLKKYAEKTWKDGRFTHTANYISALKSIKEGFENQTGRIILFSLLDPRQGGNCLIRARNEQESRTLLRPIHNEFYDFARELLRLRIGVDHFYFSKDNMVQRQLATTHYLSSLTGGSLFLYNMYNPDIHSEHLYYNIFRTVTKANVYDVDFTCRTSSGLNVLKYGTIDGIRETRDVGLSTLDPACSFTIQIEHEEKIEENMGAFLQFAMMYTNGRGERRIRVINYKYEVTNNLEKIYDSIDYLTTANLLARNYVNRLFKFDQVKVREQLINYVGNLLGEYKLKYPNWQSNKFNDLPVPSGMSWAFAYLHVIFNSKLFLNSSKATPDFRIAEILKLTSANFYSFANRFYPKLYPLTMDIYDSEILPGDFIDNQDESQDAERIGILPENIPLTKTSIDSAGVYLFNSNDHLIIMVQPNAPEDLLIDLFGTSNLEEIQTEGLPELETSHNIRVHNIIGQIRRRNQANGLIHLPLLVRTTLKKGPYGELLGNVLKEDYYDCNYAGFIDHVLRASQVK